MIKLEYNGQLTGEFATPSEAMEVAATAAAPLFPPMSPWSDETDDEGNLTGVLTSGYWRIVPAA